MPKRLFGIFVGEATPDRSLKLRQGLVPALDIDFKIGFNSYQSGGQFLSLSPDKSYMVGGIGTTSNNMFIYRDMNDLSVYQTPPVAYSSNVYACAASDTHYAFAGSNAPFVLLFKKNSDLVTLNTSGLNTVVCLDFSPDGRYLAVIHSSGTRVRIYDLTDLSFVNAASNSGEPYAGCFSHDSTKFYTFSYSSPGVSKIDPLTGARTVVSTNSQHFGSPYNTNGRRAIRYPDGKTIIYANNSSTQFVSYLDTLTDTIANGPAIPLSGANALLIVAPWSAEDDCFWVHHRPGNSGRTVSRVVFSSKIMVEDELENSVYRSLLRGNDNAYSSMVVIDSGRHKISGTVRDIDNLPAKRMVRAYQRSTGELVAQTESDAITGNYRLYVDNEGPFDVQFYTADGELLNDLFYSKVQAEPID